MRKLSYFVLWLLLGVGFNAFATDTTYWTFGGQWSPPHFGAQTGSIAGGLLLAGACNSTTVSVPGATTAMVAVVSPVTDPGSSIDWRAFVSSPGTVTVRMCALVGFTATASVFNVKVLQ